MSEQRDAYVQKLKAKMDEWNAEIKQLEAKAAQAGADAKIEYSSQLNDLKTTRKELEEKISQLQKSGEGAWEDLKAGTESAWKTLGDAVNSAMAKFK